MRFPVRIAAAVALAASAALYSCDSVDHSGESALLTVKVDSGATRFGKLYVILVDSVGRDTLWRDSLKDPSQLRRLATESYRGGPATLIIEGYTGGAKVYEERRAIDVPLPTPVKRDTLRDAAAPIASFAWSQKLLLLPYGDSSRYDTLRILPLKADRRVRITLSDSGVFALRDSSPAGDGIRFRIAALKSGQAWIHAVSLADTTRRDSASVRVATGADGIPQPENLTPRWQNAARPTWIWKKGGTGGSGFYNVRLDDDGLAGELIGDTTWKVPAPLSDGAHTLFVRAEGSNGLFSVVNGMVLNVDTQPPSAPTVANAGFDATYDPHPAWTWSRNTGGMARFRVKLDDSLLASGALAVDSQMYTAPDSLAPGSHTLFVQERDSAGNWSPSGSATVRVVLPDRTPPDPPYRLSIYYGVVEKFTWLSRGGDGAGVFRYLVDKSDFTKNTPTETPNPWFVPDANLDTTVTLHKLYVQERDSVGNWSASAEFPFSAYHFTHIRSWADTNLVLAVSPDSLNVIVAQRILAPKDAAETEALRRQLWRYETEPGVSAPWFKWTNFFLNAQLEHRGYGQQLQIGRFNPAPVDTVKMWRSEQIGFTGGAAPDKHFLISMGSNSYANIGGDVWIPGKAVILWEYSSARPNELWRYAPYLDKWFMQ